MCLFNGAKMSESQNLQDGGENNQNGTDLHETVENGEDSQSRYAELITLDNCNKGLGLKICGGCSIDGASLYGIYIKYVIPGGVAANSGQLENGDQILLVNGESLEGVTKDRAISILRRAASQNHAEILIARDDEARGEYIEVLDREHSFISSPVNTIHSPQQEQIMYNGDTNYLSGMTELESPWKQLASSPSLFTSDSPVVGLDTPRKSTLTRKTTLDPSDKVNLDKLQGRLYYIGLQPTSCQIQELHQHLVIDPYNQVTFGNFMQAVKIVFQDELNNQTINRSITSSPNKSTVKTLQNKTLNDAEDLESVSQQRDDVQHQVLKLENLLQDREKKYEKELLKMRKETQATIEENRSLKTRVHLAEQAQVEAQTLEHDYEEVVAFLETEIRDLRNQLKKGGGGGGGGGDSNQQMTALACQLKNSETRLKMYHAATDKLVIYVEHVKEVLTQPTDNIRNNDSEEKKKERREKKKQGVISLINGGQTVIKLVKSLTETAPLPFGWEEAFSEDGTRYYINHITQTTSWPHPASGVEHRTENQPAPLKGFEQRMNNNTLPLNGVEHRTGNKPGPSKGVENQTGNKPGPSKGVENQTGNKPGPIKGVEHWAGNKPGPIKGVEHWAGNKPGPSKG